MSRGSYRSVSSLPAWGLFSKKKKLIATIRAESKEAAKDLFERHGMYYRNSSRKVKRLGGQG